MKYIPFHLPSIGEEEIAEVSAVLRSGWLTTGDRTARFEKEFAEYTGSRFALAVNSCTAGLHLGLAACNIGPGDEVITTPLTFCATVNTILHVGAEPVLADIEDSGNIAPQAIADRITERTRAIIPVHYGGMPCRMTEIWRIARAHNLKVIEDAAHAAGTRYRGQSLGAAEPGAESDAVAYSFYATKNMTTGEGGMVTTNDEEMAQRMRVLALHGISRDAWKRYAENGSWFYQVLEPGFKYNLSDVQSAIGIHQLRKLNDMNRMRREYASFYTRELQDVEELETPQDCDYGSHAWHLYVLKLRPERLWMGRDEFIRELHQKGIGCSVHFIPIPLHPFFASRSHLPRNYCPRALHLYRRILSLPLYPGLTEAELRRTVDAVKQTAAKGRKSLTIRATA
jgi:dTDP-4-amino-4,6-dideoxygalactose transaminase